LVWTNTLVLNWLAKMYVALKGHMHLRNFINNIPYANTKFAKFVTK